MTKGARISLEGLKKRAHIAGSIGKKDRHSKVCTSKGPRDRRVRLSANTAIQFYDVQDRLGYDRPSKAVDWLMEKAKTAIDALAELPPRRGEQSLQHPQFCNDQDLNANPIYDSSLFHIPVSMALSSVHFQNSAADQNSGYPYLSTQSFHHSDIPSAYQTINSASSPLLFDAAASSHWPEMSQSQKMIDWDSDTSNGIQGLVFDSLSLPLQEPVHRQNQFFYEREPLQSTDSALISTWMNPHVSIIKDQDTMIEPKESPGIALS